MPEILKKISPAREPVVWAFLAAALYQIIATPPSFSNGTELVQYIVEIAAAVFARQAVTPMSSVSNTGKDTKNGSGPDNL